MVAQVPLRRLLVSLAALFALQARSADDPLLLTLNQVKVHYRKQEYGEAYTSLKRLSELAAAPEFEPARERLIPALTFYTAAIRFELRDEAGARDAAEAYLRLVPDVTLDPGLYPKKFITFFDKVKKEMAAAEQALAPAEPNAGFIAGNVLPSYASFALDDSAAEKMEADPDWGNGPVRFLFVGDEAKRWKQAALDETKRRLFQDEFWQRRDPDPSTPVNELRVEFVRRAQYAEANFSTETTHGALTDRGMVFLLLGPPNYVGRSRVDPREDTTGVQRTTEYSYKPGNKFEPALQRVDSGTPRIGAGETLGNREVWHYKSDRLSREIPWRELTYEFQSKEGYGSGVLQKDAVHLSALSKMAKVIAKPRS